MTCRLLCIGSSGRRDVETVNVYFGRGISRIAGDDRDRSVAILTKIADVAGSPATEAGVLARHQSEVSNELVGVGKAAKVAEFR